MLALLVRPGLIALTVTPRVPRSLDSATVRLCIAALVAPYAAMFTSDINPIVLAMLMIMPHCLSAISGANRRLPRTIEVTLLLYIEFHSAGSVLGCPANSVPVGVRQTDREGALRLHEERSIC